MSATALARWGSRTLIGVPMFFLIAFFLLPFLVVFKISVSEMDTVFFRDVLTWADGLVTIKINFGNYFSLAQDGLYLGTYIRSLGYAGMTALICLLIAYPFAYCIARSPADKRPALLMMVMLPFWTSFLLRIYAWKILLADSGVFNQILLALGVITEPIKMMNTPFSLILGMVYCYIPFMILPLYATLVKMDLSLLEAALDLGATPAQAFWRITVPLSKSGIIAGSMLVFIPCVGEFVIPELLGGPQTLMIGRVLWDEFFGNNDWPMAAAVAVVMVLLIIVPLALFNKHQAESNAQAAA
jgi:putrescine transport system permease protein